MYVRDAMWLLKHARASADYDYFQQPIFDATPVKRNADSGSQMLNFAPTRLHASLSEVPKTLL